MNHLIEKVLCIIGIHKGATFVYTTKELHHLGPTIIYDTYVCHKCKKTFKTSRTSFY